MAKESTMRRMTLRAGAIGSVMALAGLGFLATPAAAALKTTTTTVTATTAAYTGAPVTFTATVTHGLQTPTGTVTFAVVGADASTPVCDGGSDVFTLAPATTGSSAACSFAAGLDASGSPFTVTATYSGDSTFGTSSGMVSKVIHKGATTTAVSAASNPTVTGQGVAFTAVVAPTSPSTGVPTGTVTFTVTGRDGTAFPCDAGNTPTLDGSDMAQCAIAAGLLAGDSPYAVTAAYAGDPNYAASTGSLSQAVAKATTTVTVMSSASTLVNGQPVTFTANIAVNPPGSGTPTGSVVFSVVGNGSPMTAICDGGDTQPISSLSATCSFSAGLQAKPLSYTVSATLSDPNFKSPVAGTLVQPVSKAATMTSVFGLQGSYVASQGFTLGVEVQTTAPGIGAPTGDVEWAICQNGASICDAATGTRGGNIELAAPNAKDIAGNFNKFEISVPEGLEPGFWDVVTNFEGNGNLGSSTDTVVSHILVTTVPTTMELFLNHNPVANEGRLVIKAVVLPNVRATGSSGAPSGSITYTVTGSDSPTDTLTCNSGSNIVPISTTVNNQGIAKCVIDAGQLMSVNGPYTLQAAYSGDSTYAAVSSTGTANVAGP
jgi:large repetitive protein